MADNVVAMQVELQGAEETKNKLKGVGEALKNMGQAQEEANSKTGILSKTFGGLKAKLSGARGSLVEVLGAGLKELAPAALVGGTVAAGVAVAKFAKDSISASINLESQMNKVFTMMPGASRQAMEKMTTDVRELSKKYGSTTNDMSEAMYQALSAGVSTDNVKGFLEVAQKGAVAGVTDVTTAVDGLSSVVNAWGEKNISAAQASDLMFMAVKNGKTTFDEMAHSVAQVSPIASSLGVSFSDVSASVATLTAKGTPTAAVMTQMKAAFSEFSKSSSDASKEFKKATGSSFQEFIAKGGNLQTAMQALEAHSKKTGKNINEFFGSVEAGSFALAVTGENAEAFAKNMNDMKNAQGSTDMAFAQMDKGLGATLKKLKAQFNDVMLGLGGAIAPVLASIGQAVLGAIPVIQQFFASFAQSTEGQAYLQMLKASFDSVMAQIRALWSVCVTIFNVIVAAIGSFVSGFMAGFGQVKGETTTLSQVIGSVFQFIASIVNWAWNFISPVITALAQALGFVLGGAVKLLVESFIKLGNVLSKVGGFFKKLFGGGDAEKAKKDMEELKKGMEEINKEAEKPAKKEVEVAMKQMAVTAQQAGVPAMPQPQPIQMPSLAQMPPLKIDPATTVKIDPQALTNTQMKIDPTAMNGVQQAVQQVGLDVKNNPQIQTSNNLLGEIKAEINSLKSDIQAVRGAVDGMKGAVVGKIGEIVGAIRAIKIDVKVPAGPSAGEIANRIAGSLQKG